jgi:MFS family permease
MAFADTALDGLILDVTPKNKLAQVQAITWTMLLIGMGGGGALLGYLFLSFNAIPVLLGITGVLMVISGFLPRLIKEPPTITSPPLTREIFACFTKGRNYKVFGLNIVSAMVSVIIVTFYGYYILIDIGIISVESTYLSLISGEAIDLFEWGVLFYGANGVGVIIGSLAGARVTDKRRKLGMIFSYLIFIPFCFISNIFIGIILGVIGQIIFGFAGGAFDTAISTIRADLARVYYPNLKSFYYAIIISCWNIGMALGNLLASKLFQYLSSFQLTFGEIYFWFSIVCMGLLTLSWILFWRIDPNDYEFKMEISLDGTKQEAFFT